MTKTGPTSQVRAFSERKADKLMLAIIGASTALFTWLAYLQYAYFTTETNDLTIVTYAFAQTLRGRFFPLYYMDGSLLGNHLDLVYVMLFPIYALVPSVPFILFLQSLFISVSAWPLYLLARRKLDDNLAAVGVATAYLIFPTVASQHLNQIHDDQFANISILFAAYFFEREKFRNMGIALVVACLTKEVVALTVAMFGVWAWLARRTGKWIVFPLVLGVGWFFLGVKLVVSLLPGAGGVLYTKTPYLDLYGNTPSEVLKTMLTRPSYVLANTFGPDKRQYLLKLLGPLGLILPFISVSIVLSAPNLAINLIGTNSALTHIPWHYGVVLGATLFVAVVYSLTKVAGVLTLRFGAKRYARGIATALVGAGVLGSGMWLDTSRFRSPRHLEVLRRVVAEVPRDASVICPTPMLAHLSDRPKINTGYSIFVVNKKPEMLAEYEYVVLDGNWRAYEAIGQAPLWETIRTNRAYEVVFAKNDVVLLHRVSHPDRQN